MDKYITLNRIGEGAHGIVYKASHVQSNEIVALKRVHLKSIDEGIPHNIIREIKALQEIEDHENDLKPANLLISGKGNLKIADFGLARIFDKVQPHRQYSHQVATRWYRAPELLYGSRSYDEGVDLWAIGCIFGELINRSPLFPGESDIHQLCCVCKLLGTPTESQWPEMKDLPDYGKISFDDVEGMKFEDIVPEACKDAIDLLKRFLVYPSKQRIPAHQALLHDYFYSTPLPCHHTDLPIPMRSKKRHIYEFDIKRNILESIVDHEMILPMNRHK
ncbi:unnamed protein product [Didymodactylos carnosus]|uniref:Cyclin-dependent kinase 20 n=2 Tax=Didymodactylos carnosus TaxID=1234261 RepID=A0A814ARD2_9BILA|nr:unnamed protein product [Didymodactylos carnosus]CAF3697294.1 unnamed protein product [Didymodactylos carnosus]